MGLLIAAVVVTVIAAIGVWKRANIVRLIKVLGLFSEQRIVSNFSNMHRIFLTHDMVAAHSAPSVLPRGPQTKLPPQATQWIKDRSVTALVVLKDGNIVFEDYFKGTTETDIRINWSISKSYLSALFGVLLDEGVFDSIDDPVIKYAPEFAGSAYKAASIKNVLQMSSGVLFDEDYLRFFSDINRMGRVLALGQSMDQFAIKQTKSLAQPGAKWEYVSIDTHVIGMVIRGATGRPIHALLNEKILEPLGCEAAPYYLTDGFGTDFVLGGLNTTTRDNARFAQMFADGGRWNGRQIVPASWVDASTAASADTLPGETGYGYQWWIPWGSQTGQCLGRGIYGQYIYIDRVNNVVIATHGADRDFRDDDVQVENELMFRTIAESLS